MKLLPFALLPLAAAGCVSPENDRMTIGQSVRLEALSPQPAPTPPTPSEQVMAPSITGISRANWQPTPILIPVDGTAHTPIYNRRITWADKTARQRNENPTAATSLELYSGSEQQQEYEALNNQWQTFTDVLLIVPRMIGWAPWKVRWSPDDAYQRYWRPERPETTGGIAPSVTP